MQAFLEKLKALSQEKRLRIVLLLQTKGEICGCHIAKSLRLGRPTTSVHLEILRRAGLVQKRAEGTTTYFSLVQDPGDPAVAILLQAARMKFSGTGPLDEDLGRAERAMASNPACNPPLSKGSRKRATASANALVGILLLALGFVGCNRSPYGSSTDEPATVFMEACVTCHQGGSAGPALAGRNLTAQTVEARLSRGGEGMPSFPGIRGEARRKLVAFVVQLSGETSGR